MKEAAILELSPVPLLCCVSFYVIIIFFEVAKSVINDFDFFIKNIYVLFCLEHSLNKVIMLVYLFFELFYPVVGELACRKNTAQSTG